MDINLTAIGIVFALILVIIFFSAVVLYLAFRIKETFRKETRKGFTIVKVGFLIGILFLAGGIFYFFANTLGNITQTSPNPNQPTTPYLNLTVSNPPSVTFNSNCTVTFIVKNPTSATAHGANIQASLFFSKFTIQNSTHEVSANIVKIGDVSPETTQIVSLVLSAPSKRETISDNITLDYLEGTVTKEITIAVEGGQNETPSPSPTPSPPSKPELYLSVSSPSLVSLNTTFPVIFTVINPTNANTTVHGTTIEANALFTDFKIESSSYEVIGTVMNIGDVLPGTTIIQVQLRSQSRPGTNTYTVSLLYQEMTAPVIQQVTITVRGGQGA